MVMAERIAKHVLEGFIKRRETFKKKSGVDWRYMPSSIIIPVKKTTKGARRTCQTIQK